MGWLYDKNASKKNLPKPKASEAQVFKLLVMLAADGFIESNFNRSTEEWEYDEEAALEWVSDTMQYHVDRLEDLTQKQIGACYQELTGR